MRFHLQVQLINWIILLAIKAVDSPSEQHSAHRLLLRVASHLFQKNHFIFLMVCAKRHYWMELSVNEMEKKLEKLEKKSSRRVNIPFN